jgi:hypothetical protein
MKLMKLHLQFARLAALVVLGFVGACTSQGVGRSCISVLSGLPGEDGGAGGFSDAGVPTISIATPALDCPSRICYIQQPTATVAARGVCTATCEDDGDCRGSVRGSGEDGLCSGSFVCAVATVTGPYACSRLCVCRDDLVRDFNVDGNGQVRTPGVCSAGSVASSNP